jgi:hypothetical protein
MKRKKFSKESNAERNGNGKCKTTNTFSAVLNVQTFLKNLDRIFSRKIQQLSTRYHFMQELKAGNVKKLSINFQNRKLMRTF